MVPPPPKPLFFLYQKGAPCIKIVPMESKKTPNYIHPAGYGKTTLAFLIDAACTVAMIFLLYFALGKPVLLPAQGYEERRQEYNSFVKGSHLTQGDESGTFLSYEDKFVDGEAGYQKYEKAVLSYYEDFCVNYPGAEFQEEDKVTRNADGNIDQASLSSFVLRKVYKLNPDGTQIEEGADKYFVLNAETEDPYDVTLAPDYQGELDNVKLAELKSYFAGEKNTGAYYDAVAHFSAQPRFLELSAKLGMIRYLSFLPSFILSPFIFFFLIPVFVPNGKTIGKLLVKTAVLSKDGYKAKKLNIVLHYACLTLVWELLLLPNTGMGIMSMMLVFLIDYMALILSKKNQSLHDKIAGTMGVNSKESVWFADEETALAYAKSHPDSPAASYYRETGSLAEASPHADEDTLRYDSIVDLSTIGKAREQAKTITSFDEFENRDSKK